MIYTCLRSLQYECGCYDNISIIITNFNVQVAYHEQVVERYCKKGGGNFSNLEEDGYVYCKLLYHIVESGTHANEAIIIIILCYLIFGEGIKDDSRKTTSANHIDWGGIS